jgi:hypothetical protein
MTCAHDDNAREMAVMADGYCPLCMAAEIALLRKVLKNTCLDLHGIFPQSLAKSVYKKRTEKVVKQIEAALTTSQRASEGE